MLKENFLRLTASLKRGSVGATEGLGSFIAQLAVISRV